MYFPVWPDNDKKMRRQINYWAATVAFYVLCLSILWFEVWRGFAPSTYVSWATILAIGGLGYFYILIRLSPLLRISASQLANYQGIFAVLCIVAGYIIAGPIRGAMLALLLVVLVFCAFTLERRSAHRMSAFAVFLLGTSMIWLAHSDPVRFAPWIETAHFLLATATLFIVANLTSTLRDLRTKLKAQKSELTAALERIQTLATRDELTLLANRRSMVELLEKEERRARSIDLPDCVALLDIDWFKQVNDTYGHEAGDEVLRAFARQALVSLRASDKIGRWGGEEFLVLLPDTDQDAARAVLDRFREDVAALHFPAYTPSLRVSFSAGLVKMMPQEPARDALRRADEALYAAKHGGRNCVVSA
ncbi:MAG TPA: GGDEF domain-containing protein [Burkholderiaceae bacterium]|nr:GGDEF domain-containing protein [Burkholderiaceae bacterium]